MSKAGLTNGFVILYQYHKIYRIGVQKFSGGYLQITEKSEIQFVQP
jgi:hypothetical protein